MMFSVTYLRVYLNALESNVWPSLRDVISCMVMFLNFRLQSYRFYFKLLPQISFLLPQNFVIASASWTQLGCFFLIV